MKKPKINDRVCIKKSDSISKKLWLKSGVVVSTRVSFDKQIETFVVLVDGFQVPFFSQEIEVL